MVPFFRLRAQKLQMKQQLVQRQTAAGSTTKRHNYQATLFHGSLKKETQLTKERKYSPPPPSANTSSTADTAANSLDKARNKVTKNKTKVPHMS